MSLSTLENQIKTEYGVVRAFVALHPYVTHFIVAAVSGAIGYFWRVI